MTIEKAARWLLVLPIAVAAFGLIIFAGLLVNLWLASSSAYDYVKALSDVLASAIAVYVGAKMAPDNGRAVAAALALLAAAKEFVFPLSFDHAWGKALGFDGLTLPALAVCAASGLSALLFAKKGRSGFAIRWVWLGAAVLVSLVAEVVANFLANR